MKNYRIYFLSFLLMGSMSLYAQEDETVEEEVAPKIEKPATPKKNVPTRLIKGRVLNAVGKAPLAGAMVRTQELEGYSTLTEEDGSFEIKVPLFATSLEITAPDFNLVKQGLTKDGLLPNVLMYPVTYRADYTKGTNVLGVEEASDFGYSPAITIEEEIQKQLGADVRTVTRSGTPGIGSVMFINGINSLNVNAQPLVVVDGVIYDQQYNRQMVHSGFYNDILSNISPADIEKVTVMRNGTALYGAKGANGVILIQTRRNHSMATRITASVSGGVSLEPKYLDVMNENQFIGYASELLKTTNTTLNEFKFLNNQYYYRKYHGNNTDWKDYVYRSALTQNYSINVEGGDAVANYNLSLGYTNSQSTLKYNGMDRLNIRFNTDILLSDKFSVRFDASFANQTRNIRDDGAPTDYNNFTPSSPSFLAYAKSPMMSPYAYVQGAITNIIDTNDEDYLNEALSDYNNYNWKLGNPLALNIYSDAENKNRFENSMINLAVSPKFQINPHLYVQEHFSYNLVNTNETYYLAINGVPAYYVANVGAVRQNEVRSLFSKQNSIMSDTRVDWNNQYYAHSIHVMGGARINWENYTMNNQLGYNTGSDKTPQIRSSLLNMRTVGSNDNWNSLAWYAQADYNFKQRYYLQANLTAESSSRFGKDGDSGIKMAGVVWGIFPSVQASWVVTNEPWFANVQGIDYLKFTAGFDVSGNDDIDYYASRSYFIGSKFLNAIAALQLDNIGNTKIQWETTKRFNIGLEGNFINNRLNVRFNYFNSKTDNLLTYQTLKYVSGIEKNWSNGGALKNQGFDASATAKVLTTRNWQWEIGGSVGHYVNKITALPDNTRYIDTEIYGATVRSEIGKAANLFYGYKTKGVFASTEDAQAANLRKLNSDGVSYSSFGAGDMHFTDVDNNHVINDNDRIVIGDPNPDIYGNIFTSVMFKRFKLDVNFNYSLGNDVYNYMRSQLEGGSRFMNQTTAMTRRWQVEGQVTDVPKATFQDPMGNSSFSDRWIEDGSYLKLKTITLSYKLPMNSTFLQGLEFWIQANNVFTVSKYLGTDPEFSATSSVLGQGIDAGLLPQSRNFMAGVKINL